MRTRVKSMLFHAVDPEKVVLPRKVFFNLYIFEQSLITSEEGYTTREDADKAGGGDVPMDSSDVTRIGVIEINLK